MHQSILALSTPLSPGKVLALSIPPLPGNLRAFVMVTGHWYLQSCTGDGELFTGRVFISTGCFCDEHVLLN